jgi:hypothetical protein
LPETGAQSAGTAAEQNTARSRDRKMVHRKYQDMAFTIAGGVEQMLAYKPERQNLLPTAR